MKTKSKILEIAWNLESQLLDLQREARYLLTDIQDFMDGNFDQNLEDWSKLEEVIEELAFLDLYDAIIRCEDWREE